MTGWEKVFALTGLALVVLVGLNVAMWRQMRRVLRDAPRDPAPPPASPDEAAGTTPAGSSEP